MRLTTRQIEALLAAAEASNFSRFYRRRDRATRVKVGKTTLH